MRSIQALLGLSTLLLLVPAASACEGLSPGDQLVVGDVSCTLAFLLADENGLYFATAGHCIHENATASSPGVGNFGVGAFHYLVPETGSESDGSPGQDFALIRVDPSYYDKLNPKVCGWAGPTGIYDSKPGGGDVHHYGYGLLFGDVGPETRTRTGYNLDNNNTAFYWTGMGVPGDSGSAVLAADGPALGVLTHLVLSPPDTNGGTHLLRGFELAKEKGFSHLRLVLAGEDPVKVLSEMRANATRAVALPAKPNATNTTQAHLPPASNSTQSSAAQANGATTTTPPGEPLQPQGTSDVKKTPGFEVVLISIAGLAALLRRRA